ncbi:hypothetical protein P389DRAFT_167128 [Cystobasidium minutum MCA 4210]|uniref:uncharacterized protein n=1 Tax=Cystobasidium minutum MCA 4210 TaxID=1397322 RepID=UPI0034CEB2C2|eukprot:jgi/Rhomi1/167128/fgenesh1_kg.2_\
MPDTLIDTTNELLTGFSQHKLYAVDLKNELLERASREHEQQQQQQSQLARSTTENLTSYTNLSDGSGFSVDPNDLKRLDGDMERYKSYFSQVKLQWLETLLKRKTLQRLLGTLPEDEQDGIEGIITLEHVQMLEEVQSKQKQELKQSKAEAEQLSLKVAVMAKELDISLNQQLQPAIEEARALTRSLQDMELKLAMLRNSRTEEERMTVEEASQYLDEQIETLQNLAQQLEENQAAIVQQKQSLVTKQRESERLTSERHNMERLEKEARNAVKNKDKRVEEACRQLADRTGLMSAVLGIKAVQPGTNGELKVVYDLGSGKTATLAIYSDVNKRQITGAALLNSNVSIEDCLQRCLKTNDLQELVLEVLLKIA